MPTPINDLYDLYDQGRVEFRSDMVPYYRLGEEQDQFCEGCTRVWNRHLQGDAEPGTCHVCRVEYTTETIRMAMPLTHIESKQAVLACRVCFEAVKAMVRVAA